MNNITDYKCTPDDTGAFPFPLCESDYRDGERLAVLSRKEREQSGSVFCRLPFCHTVEAEAFGGKVYYDGKSGPRTRESVCGTLDEVLALPDMNFRTGMVKEVLSACKSLGGCGECVLLEISGPLTILNGLTDLGMVFRSMRKEPEKMKKVYGKLRKNLLCYAKEAVKQGVPVISYADSAAGVSILGKKMAAQMTEEFTWPFLKELEKLLGNRALVVLCPKTTLMLIGTGKAVFRDIGLPEALTYGEACREIIGKAAFAGQMCMKNKKAVLKRIKSVELL